MSLASHRLYCVLSLSVAASCLAETPVAFAETEQWTVQPERIELQGNFSRCQLLVTAAEEGGQAAEDWTRKVQYQSSDPAVCTVDANGRVLAVGDGSAEILATLGERSQRLPVTVAGVVPEPAVSFDLHVRPILSKAGCNMGACHASQYGKGGFKLSVFGFEPNADHAAIVRDRLGRRVNFHQPELSLLLRKPTMQTPHGGGRRLEADSVDYRILAQWIRGGAGGTDKQSPVAQQLRVTPSSLVSQPGGSQQLRVEAVYSDGKTCDVTAWAKFDSMDEAVLQVGEDGLVNILTRGQAPVMIRFEGLAEISTFSVPYPDDIDLGDWQPQNFIDELAAKKFIELGIQPSPLADDAAFVRRAFLDAVGAVPSLEETTAFLNSDDPDKRTKLIDRLLGLTGDPAQDIYNDRYSAYWTLKWSDLIRNNSNQVGEQGMWALHNWIKEAFRTNKPFDRFVSELVTGKGSIYMNGPANYFRINANAADLTESTAQLFLGIRLQCAKCHHHPFEKYSQEDYQGFSRFFSRVGTKNSQEFGLFGRESVVLVRATGGVSGLTLDGESVTHELDLRIPLAKWLTAPENEYFSKSVVNRYMSYLFGRGLVEPVDDMRDTNPPTNVELMDALSKYFVESGFDLKQLLRVMMTSRLYQLSSQPTETNAKDDRFYSHFKVKRISAEPMLDAIDYVAGVQTKFRNLPMGTRAIELPDAEYPNYFLNTFAKPKRASVCECERVPDENLAQALHTLNGDVLAGKIADKSGRVAKLLAAEAPHEQIVEELYLAALARRPTEAEYEAARQFLAESPNPQECYEDLLWALINSKQFLFIR